MAIIKPLRNNIMFAFLDDTGGARGRFSSKTAGGILLPGLTAAGQHTNRWGKVLYVGPDCTVKPGEFILIEEMMWMEGNVVDGEKMWKTDESKVICVTDHQSACQVQYK